MTDLSATLAAAEPPTDLSRPLQALWWLKKGALKTGPDWERAHAICQASEGEPAYDRVHALAHWIEGDRSNADYWYRRSGAARSGADPAEEWQAQVTDLGGQP